MRCNIYFSNLDAHKHPFHIAGSDASGIVWAVGSKVHRWKVGDEVIVHCDQDDGDDSIRFASYYIAAVGPLLNVWWYCYRPLQWLKIDLIDIGYFG